MWVKEIPVIIDAPFISIGYIVSDLYGYKLYDLFFKTSLWLWEYEYSISSITNSYTFTTDTPPPRQYRYYNSYSYTMQIDEVTVKSPSPVSGTFAIIHTDTNRTYTMSEQFDLIFSLYTHAVGSCSRTEEVSISCVEYYTTSVMVYPSLILYVGSYCVVSTLGGIYINTPPSSRKHCSSTTSDILKFDFIIDGTDECNVTFTNVYSDESIHSYMYGEAHQILDDSLAWKVTETYYNARSVGTAPTIDDVPLCAYIPGLPILIAEDSSYHSEDTYITKTFKVC